jgi:hypothetical protein
MAYILFKGQKSKPLSHKFMQNFNSTYKPSPLGLQTASQLPLRHKAKEPDKFDGESIEWRDYIVH